MKHRVRIVVVAVVKVIILQNTHYYYFYYYHPYPALHNPNPQYAGPKVYQGRHLSLDDEGLELLT